MDTNEKDNSGTPKRNHSDVSESSPQSPPTKKIADDGNGTVDDSTRLTNQTEGTPQASVVMNGIHPPKGSQLKNTPTGDQSKNTPGGTSAAGYHVLCTAINKNIQLGKRNPMHMAAALYKVVGNVRSTKPARNGGLIVILDHRKQVKKLVECHLLEQIDVICKEVANQPETETKVVIRRVLTTIPDEDIGSEIARANATIKNVRRVYKRGQPTETVILSFPGKTAPESVYLGFQSYKTEPYTPAPPRCYNCQKFGHTAASCRSQTTCPRCGGSHGYSECENLEKPFCTNCHANHSAAYPHCEMRLRANKIQKIKFEQHVTYMEATRVYNEQKKEQKNEQEEAYNKAPDLTHHRRLERTQGNIFGAAPQTQRVETHYMDDESAVKLDPIRLFSNRASGAIPKIRTTSKWDKPCQSPYKANQSPYKAHQPPDKAQRPSKLTSSIPWVDSDEYDSDKRQDIYVPLYRNSPSTTDIHHIPDLPTLANPGIQRVTKCTHMCKPTYTKDLVTFIVFVVCLLGDDQVKNKLPGVAEDIMRMAESHLGIKDISKDDIINPL